MPQISSLYRQGIVRPLDYSAREELATFFVRSPIRCEWIPIVDDASFATIWRSGLLQTISSACSERISDYEESVIPAALIANALAAVNEFSASASDVVTLEFATRIKGLLSDARRDNMPVYFIL